MNSYHIFYSPFKWENTALEGANKSFSEQTDLTKIVINPLTKWKRGSNFLNDIEQQQLYNEKNYYYPYVHKVLYDDYKPDALINHYEREETSSGNVTYTIAVRNGKTYTLKVEAINLNLYATGVGLLSFFLANERNDQKDPQDILTINQYGRRIFPPFYDDIESKIETAEYVSIDGLLGNPQDYREDFSGYSKNFVNEGTKELKTWQPACFITKLINDLSENIAIEPVIDGRMFVNCWYENNKLSKSFGCDDKSLKLFFSDDYLHDNDKTYNFWYKYVFVDANSPNCKNDEMQLKLLQEQTYKRWQKDGMLYGISRYSFVFLSKNDEFQRNILAVYMRTVYSRMIELALIQRASLLRFSGKVTEISKLSGEKKIFDQVSSLYHNYIQFVNQCSFREVTTQEQGIELYQLILNTLETGKQITDLDKEIEELHRYVSLIDDKTRNRNSEILNYIAAGFLPATLIFTFFGTNEQWCANLTCGLPIGIAASAIIVIILKLIKKK